MSVPRWPRGAGIIRRFAHPSVKDSGGIAQAEGSQVKADQGLLDFGIGRVGTFERLTQEGFGLGRLVSPSHEQSPQSGQGCPGVPERSGAHQFLVDGGAVVLSPGDSCLEAEICWTDALRLDPIVPEAGWALVDLLDKEGRTEEARAWHRLVLHDWPDNARSLAALGRLK